MKERLRRCPSSRAEQSLTAAHRPAARGEGGVRARGSLIERRSAQRRSAACSTKAGGPRRVPRARVRAGNQAHLGLGRHGSVQHAARRRAGARERGRWCRTHLPAPADSTLDRQRQPPPQSGDVSTGPSADGSCTQHARKRRGFGVDIHSKCLNKRQDHRHRVAVERARQPCHRHALQLAWYAAWPQALRRQRMHRTRRRKRRRSQPGACLHRDPTTSIESESAQASKRTLHQSSGRQPKRRLMCSAWWLHQAPMTRRAAGCHKEDNIVSRASAQQMPPEGCRPNCTAVRCRAVTAKPRD